MQCLLHAPPLNEAHFHPMCLIQTISRIVLPLKTTLHNVTTELSSLYVVWSSYVKIALLYLPELNILARNRHISIGGGMKLHSNTVLYSSS